MGGEGGLPCQSEARWRQLVPSQAGLTRQEAQRDKDMLPDGRPHISCLTPVKTRQIDLCLEMCPAGAQPAFSTGRNCFSFLSFFFFKDASAMRDKGFHRKLETWLLITCSASCQVQTGQKGSGWGGGRTGDRDPVLGSFAPAANTRAGPAGEGGLSSELQTCTPTARGAAQSDARGRRLSRAALRGIPDIISSPARRRRGGVRLPRSPNVHKCQLVILIRREQAEAKAVF